MKNHLYFLLCILACILSSSCEKPGTATSGNSGFIEAVPETIVFTNAEFTYNGDDIGEAVSDGWLIKMYTDMETDESGAPIGPGKVMQILLNARYDENQSADASFLSGTYSEMYNSGDFAPGTFVSGYMSAIYLPGGERIDIADATFYADVAEGSTEMDYDLLDEGALSVEENGDGTWTIKGIAVGKKFTKRYFSWTGEIKVKSTVQQATPNSTLTSDKTDLAFTKGWIQDKDDSFFLQDQSYRCLLVFLGDEGTEISYGRPTGNGKVLRMELLVPWDTDIRTDGIPAGSYVMTERNPDTSIDRDRIVPGCAVPGLPDVFAEWKMGGTWYYEMQDGQWTGTYARVDSGTIEVSRGEDGSHTITFDLKDSQGTPYRISGKAALNELETI